MYAMRYGAVPVVTVIDRYWSNGLIDERDALRGSAGRDRY